MKYIVRIDNQDYEVEIRDLHARPIIAEIDGEAFEVMPANGGPIVTAPTQPAAAAPASTPARPALTTPVRPQVTSALGGASVRAPIPGVILTIMVKPGQAVAKGQELFVIEAMKMKNVVRSHRDGVIAEIVAAPGQTVSHNAIVVTFSEA
jgi:biotin carboxyl carrier protein